MISVVFLDRDGVINENREDYVKSVEEFEFLPGVFEALRRLRAGGVPIVIVSNQQGVGRGVISPEALSQINHKFISGLAEHGVDIAGVYYCPHLKEDNCRCRKPKPGLLLKAADELGIDLRNSVIIGDSPSDIEAGRAAGCATVLVLSGKSGQQDASLLPHEPDYIAADVSDAVSWVFTTKTDSRDGAIITE